MKTLTHSLQTLVMEIATNTADLKRFFLSTLSEKPRLLNNFGLVKNPVDILPSIHTFNLQLKVDKKLNLL
jgi:hypothetical protein